MINLLPPEIKQDYRYGRKNRKLLNWLAAFLIAFAGVIIITIGGEIILNKSINTYKSQVASQQTQLIRKEIATTQSQVTDISNNLKLMVQVLSKEILFSKLLTRLGSITPSNAVLTNLAISQTQSAIDITAQTGSYNAATQLQINLADPTNQIFSKADIENITCGGSTQVTNSKYPCTASIRAEFTKNNPFLFINASNKS